MGLCVLRFWFWVQVQVQVGVRVKGLRWRSDLQRWFLDTRVGRIHRWRKSQCGRELLSAQMLHRLKKKIIQIKKIQIKKTSAIDFHSRRFDSFRSKIFDVRLYASFRKQCPLLAQRGI